MTAEEAISILRVAVAEVEWNYPMDYAVAIDTAIQALEKQIPQKTVLSEDIEESVYKECPICRYAFVGGKYCAICGQALASEFVGKYAEVKINIDMGKKIYKSKCRYCGGDLEMYTHSDRNFDGSEVGYTLTLCCQSCAGYLFEFSESEDDIPNAKKRLLESYGIKEHDK